jgi:NAD(P)-dependent dehydrogenase (short-subunit alcohol dehydrogenase family)
MSRTRNGRPLGGLVVVITGAGRGIGAATAAALAARGARVAIADLDGDLAIQTAQRIGNGATGSPVDVTDHAAYRTFLDDVEHDLGPIDVLINNAGIMPVTLLHEETDESIARQIAINLHAVIFGTREAVRRMLPRHRGHIINVSSLAGVLPVPGVATYCATKHGVVAYSEVARAELAGTGVEISCVMPGIVKTELSVGMADSRYLRSVTPEQVAEAIVETLQHPRFDVYVPKQGAIAHRLVGILPRRLGEAVSRATGADHAITDTIGTEARKAYEERAARDIAKPSGSRSD